MPRQARLKFEGEGYYHVYSKVARRNGEYPLAEAKASRKFIETLKFYADAYCCEVYAFVVMGNHYHVVLHFDDYRPLKASELNEAVKNFYPNTFDQVKLWTDEQWERFNRRLFNVSEFMRSVQSSYARWYNKEYERKGRFWADRFKSTLLGDERSVLECMQYVELNPIRANMVASRRPENYAYSSLHFREIGKAKWLAPLQALMGLKSKAKALKEYKMIVYYRGGVASKEDQAVIPEKVLIKVEKEGFSTQGLFKKKLRFYNDGMVVGSDSFVKEWLEIMRENARYIRRKNPISLLGGYGFCLRDQRSHFQE